MIEKLGRTFAIAAFVAACGGSSKPAATPEPPPSEDTPPGAWSDTGDGGTAAASDTASASAPTAEAAKDESSSAGSSTAAAQGSEEGARTLLKQFVDPKADHAALTKSLRPTSADYKAMFDAAAAPKVEAAQAKEWDGGKIVIKPKEKQTELKLASASGAELAGGSGQAKEFPGGYKKFGKHLAPAVTFYAFKFTSGGKDAGTAFDGLAFVNGHWVIAPKPWAAGEAAGGGGGGGGTGTGGGGGKHGGKGKHPKHKK